MLENDAIVKVRNRENGVVGYEVPELGVRRRFTKLGEIKAVTMDELRKLTYLPGGEELLRHYLIINEPEAVEELIPGVEPEYYYTEEHVKKLLLQGTKDQFLDCLDWAPEGVLDLIKDLAVDLKINDLTKRQLILEKLQFDVSKAIMVNEESEAPVEEDTRERRASAITLDEATSAAPVTKARRTATVRVDENGK